MSNNDRFLYNQFVTALFESNSCLIDLIFLKDYQKIIRSKIEEDDSDDINDKYSMLYRHQVNAEKMRRYIEQNMISCYAVNEWDLLIELQNGDKFIFDSFRNIIFFDLYKNDELTEDEEKREFTKNLKKLLDRKHMTQEELAHNLGVSQVTISNYINGKRIPDSITLKKIARALGCSTDDFFYKRY